jgi:hypothetical protein
MARVIEKEKSKQRNFQKILPEAFAEKNCAEK